MKSFWWRYYNYVSQKRYNFFPFGPPQSKFMATLVFARKPLFAKKIRSTLISFVIRQSCDIKQIMMKKVAPVKRQSIPRLELCAAVLAVRLAGVIEREHHVTMYIGQSQQRCWLTCEIHRNVDQPLRQIVWIWFTSIRGLITGIESSVC